MSDKLLGMQTILHISAIDKGSVERNIFQYLACLCGREKSVEETVEKYLKILEKFIFLENLTFVLLTYYNISCYYY
jgi:hypothetical protein